ncbi:MAG: radical SAM protein [Synergistaceae bacterium]|nr:radical SAM protein [Synergistaceae bacterium]MBR0035452.1 radical SAM protein [Synergistaceae bacterium]
MKKLVKQLLRSLLPESAYGLLRQYYFRLRIWKRRAAARIKVPLGFASKPQHENIALGFHVTEHCNLNCASCDNFSPLADPEFLDVEEFSRDLSRMAELFRHHDCDRISLLGGEPLLHPELISIIKIVRKNFTSGRVRLLTNGILLTQQSPDFWKTCHDNKVTIVVTHYPINIDVRKIRELAGKYDVTLECSDIPIETFLIEPVNLKGNGSYRVNFAACTRGNRCIMLRQGKLYTCTFASNIHHFCKKFGVNIPVTEADYINIYDENITGEEILRRLAEPIPICRFCDMHFKLIKWHRSEQDINEWL